MTIDHKMLLSEIKDYVFITLGLCLYTFGLVVFIIPYEIVTGGVMGASLVVNYATGFKIEYTYAIINISLLVLALKVLGWRFLLKTIYATAALYFLLEYAQELMPKIEGTDQFVQILGPGNNFMSLLIGCTLTGSSLAIVFLNNGSTGGTDIIAAVVNKFFNLSLGQVLFLVDIFIIGSCFFFPQFGTYYERARMTVFGLCTMIVENFMLDYVMNARRESVQFLIFSRKYQEIANAIALHTDHGVTILDGHGWYTGKEMKVLCVLAKKNESQMIFRLIKLIDPNAFVSQSAVIGVYGEGFDTIKVKAKEMPEPPKRVSEEKKE